ncbi:MAG TPA: SIMPL domain-containing protein, partial [Cryptosporangiaceae bacterium]|nr:SIMPL domain-containing protein [Cryptosporangiaceae bacterium]
GEVVSAALTAAGDAGRLHDLSLVVDDDRAAKAEARRLAFADAIARAELYGELTGRRLGPVQAVREHTGQLGGGGGMVMRAFAADSAGMPVEAGNQEVTVTVEARWDLLG